MKIYLEHEDAEDFLHCIQVYRQLVTNNNKKHKNLFNKLSVKIVKLDNFTKTLTGKESLRVVDNYEL